MAEASANQGSGAGPAANPYAAPQSAVSDAPADGYELATRGERFAAAIIDGLCFGGVGILAAVVAPRMQGVGETAIYATVIIAFIAVAAINLRLLYTSAATIGKRALKIRVARTDGSQPSLSRLVFMRGLPQWLISAIPYVGNLFSLVDALFIFGSARRCVHDYIADTIVITAPAGA